MTVAGIALFVVGLVVGAAVNSHHAQIAAQQKQITAQQKQVRSLRQDLVTADAQTTSARAKMAKAQAQYASREAAVRKLQRQLRHEHAVAASAAGTGTTAQPPASATLGCKVLQTGTSEEFNVTTTGGGSYQGTVYVSFYGQAGSGQVFPSTTVNGATPTGAWHQVPAADIGASAEPIGCTATAG